MPIRHFFRSTTMLSSIVGASFIAVLTAQAADAPITKAPYAAPPALPAVDGINYKFDVLGGSLAEHGFAGARGAVSIPLGFRYGLQQKARLMEMKARGIERVRTEADRPGVVDWYVRKFRYRIVGTARKKHPFGLASVDHWTVLELDLRAWQPRRTQDREADTDIRPTN